VNRGFLALALAIVACGCRGSAHRSARTDPAFHPVGVAMAGLSDATWTQDGRFVLDQAGDTPAHRLWEMRADGTGLRRLALPDIAGCAATSYRSPQLLADGRIGLVRDCWKPLGVEPIVTSFAVALDSRTEQVEELAPLSTDLRYSNGTPHGDVTAHTVAWNRTLTAGYTDDGTGCETMYSVDRRGAHPLNVEIGDGANRWNLKSMAELYEPGRGCPRWGAAGLPKIARNSDEVVFFASSRLDRLDRLEGPFDLYRMRIGGRSPQRFASGLRFLTGMELSPDGRWLAFTAEYRGKAPGLWLVNMKTTAVQHVANGDLRTPSWAANGHTIAALLFADDSRRRLVTIDVTALVKR
jgi:hypothetical protein